MNNPNPKGGVRIPSTEVKTNIIPKARVEYPTALTMGSRIGSIKKIIALTSIKQPRKRTMSSNINIINIGDSPAETAKPARYTPMFSRVKTKERTIEAPIMA